MVSGDKCSSESQQEESLRVLGADPAGGGSSDQNQMTGEAQQVLGWDLAFTGGAEGKPVGQDTA